MGGVNRTRSGGPVGANLVAVRSHNAALVLDLLRTAGAPGISRLELAERTGLTPQAVSKITARLRDEGFAAEAGRRASTGGKPRTVLRLVPEAGHAVGVHLDRDELRAVLVDLDGTVVGQRRGPLDLGAGAEAVLGVLAGAVEELVAEVLGGDGLATAGSLLGVGVALPGPLDHTRGVLHRVTGFPEWEGFALRDALTGRLGVPVVVDKDTNAAALGLSVAGEGGSFAYLHLGTGLGAGLVIGGHVHRGARTGAGEFGHQVLQLDGPACGCGNRGCVEVLCLSAVGRGEVGEAARVLGVGAGNLVGLLDIDLVLLGGRTVAAAPDAYVRGVADVLDARARREGVPGGTVPVRVAPGGERLVAEGAAQLLLAPLFGRSDA
ncbi:ROK family transcriptional regulator [Streptomyces collinus]|uniref:ROK-family transcriptional regulator n=1 Tax=Streptomyces collinus (strain DSM 40733 / Tue 365) TaxID=1214242 RepID=S5VN81_STRC3|nr:ROK family transcriptional regulator [Streptomyces collinus]AGS69815.1 ROK-family transcriptional regulator [Streptomyces collinus Tu 365]UJA08456.1 ROK family transcriptional regulator [Streptomyces collinus]UJA16679.1 ROK family transcriptional regulator [Streptomyces collinus]